MDDRPESSSSRQARRPAARRQAYDGQQARDGGCGRAAGLLDCATARWRRMAARPAADGRPAAAATRRQRETAAAASRGGCCAARRNSGGRRRNGRGGADEWQAAPASGSGGATVVPAAAR
ncbi:hypothetical protein Scep_015014 [Stephania cephalantha]|uniref:Uncharacterized protein n=1 Tax=Stephania cephalantha TaxID=152367 RepID=A0AAP0J4A3_9MAGN